MKFNFKQAVLILLVMVALAGLHLYINTQNIGLQYQVTELRSELDELRSANRLLGSQAAAKERLDLIETKALEKLGMIYPEKINYVPATDEAKP
ncbi:MAG: hypothetical protein JW782_06845 [Candidatus Saganbacteria bacterium]|nr:hypothetical protein [Candidatus Saganbacteria bacterium]